MEKGFTEEEDGFTVGAVGEEMGNQEISEVGDEELVVLIDESEKSPEEKVEIEKPGDKAEVDADGNPIKKEEELDDFGKLSKQLGEKQGFIDKQAGEIGDLRRDLRSMQLNLATPPKEKVEGEIKPEDFWADPVKTVRSLMEGKDADTQSSNDRNAIMAKMVKEELAVAVPNLSEIQGKIADMALEDGYPSELVNAFRQTGMGDPAIIKGLATRVALAGERDGLNHEIETLKAQLKKNGVEIAEKIDRAAAHSEQKPLSSKPAVKQSKERHITVDELPEQSDKAITALLKTAIANEK